MSLLIFCQRAAWLISLDGSCLADLSRSKTNFVKYEEEGKLGIPQTPYLKDLDQIHVLAKGEAGFIKFIVLPLWRTFNTFVEGAVDRQCMNLDNTMNKWNEIHAKNKPPEPEAKPAEQAQQSQPTQQPPSQPQQQSQEEKKPEEKAQPGPLTAQQEADMKEQLSKIKILSLDEQESDKMNMSQEKSLDSDNHEEAVEENENENKQ